MMMSEKDLRDFLCKHPDMVYDKKRGIIRQGVSAPSLSHNNADYDKLTASSDKFKENNVPVKAKNKYWNVKLYEYEDGFVGENGGFVCHGRVVSVYDSVKEFNRWFELKSLQAAGNISGLKRQCKYVIEPAFVYNGEKIKEIAYKADFVYIEKGKTIVEDVKGYDEKRQKYLTTKDFNLKWKLLKKRYPEIIFRIF